MNYKERWDKYFDLLDANKSGFISVEDNEGSVKNFAKTFGIPEGTFQYNQASIVLTQFLENFIKETDANGDGQVTREELHDYIKKVIANGKEKAPAWWRQSNKDLFDVIDFDQSGDITLSELSAVVKRIYPKETDENIQKAFSWAKSISGKNEIDAAAFFDIAWVWGTSPKPTPEADIFYPHVKKN